MKNILFLFALLLAGITADAQRFEVFKNPAGVAFDTVANSGTKTLASGQITAAFDHIGIQVNLERLSGAAGGNVYLQGSIDGTYFVNIDTLSVANTANQSLLFLLEKYPYAYLRTSYTGTGTMSVIIRVRGLYKKK